MPTLAPNTLSTGTGKLPVARPVGRSHLPPGGSPTEFDWVPDDALLDTLTDGGWLAPTARRVAEASWVCAISLEAVRLVCSRGGDSHLLHEQVPGLRLWDEPTPGRAGPPESGEPPVPTAGWYRLREPLGRGANGTVFEGEDVFGGGRVAVKLLPTRGPEGHALAERFFNGAAVARHLALPGCATASATEREFGHAFLVSPLAADGSILDLHRSSRLTPPEATALCGQAARTLAAVHAAGFAHGNIKGGNLLLGPVGVLLADFALPSDALSAHAAATRPLQAADVSALAGVYADLLGGPHHPPKACRELLGRTHPSAAALAAAFDDVGRALSMGVTSRLSAPDVTTVVVPLPSRRVPSPGDLLGKCLLTEKIGEGATGVVYKATHQTLSVDVAVKVLSAVAQGQDKLADQFAAEARMLARLNHPNVVRIWDFEVGAEFPPYLVLEYVAGGNLDELIRRSGAIPPAQAVPLFAEVIDGLECGQRQAGLIHRDIKPANILLASDGVAKVADLGLASILEVKAHLAATIVGTPAYMAPEQVNGALSADHRTDIYSLGATLYHAVTGQMPFTGKSRMQVLFKHLNEAPVPPHQIHPAVPPALSAVVLRMMAKRPEDRFQTYEQLLDALAAAFSDSANPVSPPKSGMSKKSSILRRLFGR